MTKGRRADPTLSFPAEPARVDSAHLVIAPGTAAERRVPLAHRLAEGPMIIGSDPDVDVPIDDPHVSARHCELSRSAAGIQLTDLGSRNGTKVQCVAVHGALLEPG